VLRNRTQSENSDINSINSYEDSDETDSPYYEEKEENEGYELIGGRDEYGCLGPAGYTWSKEIGACARVWEINSDELILVARTAVAKATMTYSHDKYPLTVLSIEPLNCETSLNHEGCYLVSLERYDYKNDERSFFTVEVIVDTKTVNPGKSNEFEVMYLDGKVYYAGTVEKPTPCDTLKIKRVISDSKQVVMVIDITFEKSDDVVCTQESSYETFLGDVELANPPASVTIRLQGRDVYTKTF
jgi:hypothetical protein